ncbi:Synaptonemal complex protein 3 [Lamellibrachia satsuma]|nr:Synaptonemal complex protein 3 [Lamellibrachia satsuma]
MRMCLFAAAELVKGAKAKRGRRREVYLRPNSLIVPIGANMPRANIKKPQAAAACKSTGENHDANYVQDDDILPDSQHSSTEENDVAFKTSRKRNSSYLENETQDFGGEMQKMFECFGADIAKTVATKRKRLEQYTQSSLKSSSRKVEDIWKIQQNERQKLNEEFQKQANAIIQQWETDVEKGREQEEKLQVLIRQQQKLFQQTRIVQSQRLKTIRQLHEQYTKGIEDLERCHHDQQTNVHTELKKEMALLQKKILMDTQQQEMASVRKSLQTMLF